MKKCIRCQEIKSENDFFRHKGAKDGISSYCKICDGDKAKNHRIENREQYNLQKRKYRKKYPDYDKKHREENREYYKNWRLVKYYGITFDDFITLFDEQEGKCAICGKYQIECKRALSVDHDHKTGKVRGLLCTNCNILLGNSFDNIDILKRAIAYLSKTEAMK